MDHNALDLGQIFPNLTPRELAIIPYLVEGGTAEEIGQHFGVSAETIKKHRHNISAKFGASSVRDVHANMADFVTYYCGPSPLFRVCCEKTRHHVQVFAQKQQLIATIQQTFRTIVGPVEELKFIAPDDDKPVRDIKIAEGVIEYETKFLGQDTYVTRLPQTAQTGDLIHRSITVTRSVDLRASGPFYYTALPRYPTGHLDFSVDLMDMDHPPKFHHRVGLGFVEITDPNLRVEFTNSRYRLRTFHPQIHQSMTIFWE